MFKKQHSQDKYLLIEDICLKPHSKETSEIQISYEKEIPESPSSVTEEQRKKVQNTSFESQEAQIIQNKKQALQEKDQHIPQQLKLSQGEKIPLLNVSKNKQLLFSEVNKEKGELSNDSPGRDSAQHSGFKNG
ncbi:MAG: hypothetical protein LEGION0398_MBIBDBAK_01421 [Legionellaceae bacterium]